MRGELKATATLVLVFALVAGCGASGDSSSLAGTRIQPQPAGSQPAVVNADGPGPAVRAPTGPPPRHLVIIDLRPGNGAEAGAGDDVTLRYVGVRWNGELQTNSWTFPRAPSFELGTIALGERGLDEGIRGMRVGGRREILIPASRRAYPGVEVRLDEAIEYVVDLVSVG